MLLSYEFLKAIIGLTIIALLLGVQTAQSKELPVGCYYGDPQTLNLSGHTDSETNAPTCNARLPNSLPEIAEVHTGTVFVFDSPASKFAYPRAVRSEAGLRLDLPSEWLKAAQQVADEPGTVRLELGKLWGGPRDHFDTHLSKKDPLVVSKAANLRVEFYSDWLTPTQPVSGAPATLRFHVRNFGENPVHDFKTHLYMNDNLVGSWEFHHIDENEDPAHRYRPLWPKQATPTFEYVTPPLSGTSRFRWVVDPEGAVWENDKNDNVVNCAIAAVAKSTLPDLVVKLISPPEPVEIGHTATLRVQVHNNGLSDIDRSFYVFVKSDGSHIITEKVTQLVAGGMVIFERSVRANQSDKRQIVAIADVYNEINETNEQNNIDSASISFDSVDLQLASSQIAPAFENKARPVLSFEITNNGNIDATRPFSIRIAEIYEGPEVEKFNQGPIPVGTVEVSDFNLPAAGETIRISLPIEGWDFMEGKIYVATKKTRRFYIKVDSEAVYTKKPSTKDAVNLWASVYELYKPWMKGSLAPSENMPNSYFLRFITPTGGIQKKTFALEGIITKSSGGGSGSSGIGGNGSSDYNILEPFIETAKWFAGLFKDVEDDNVRNWVNNASKAEIKALDDDQIVDMIKKLFDGPTLDEDENAINKILESLPPAKFSSVVSKLGGLSNIDDEVDGSEWDRTLELVVEKGSKLPLDDKLELIKGLFETTTGDDEERAIIKLVQSMSKNDRWEMLQKPGFSKENFDDDVDGDEWDELEKLLDEAVDGYWREKPVVEIQQGQSCWAAALSSFLKSSGKNYEPAELQYLFSNVVQANGGLKPRGLYSVRDYFLLEMDPYFPQVGGNPNQIVLRYDRLTKSFLGPKLKNSHILLIYTDPAWGVQWSHAIVVWGADSNQLCFMDPVDGQYKCETYIKFPSNHGYIILWKK